MPSTLTEPVVAEPTTPIKPSEAVRLGRLIYPVRLTDGRAADWREHAACAIAAIWTGGYKTTSFGRTASCPVTTKRLLWTRSCTALPSPLDASYLVIHLNDYHKWSDDQIVAWLESLGL